MNLAALPTQPSESSQLYALGDLFKVRQPLPISVIRREERTYLPATSTLLIFLSHPNDAHKKTGHQEPVFSASKSLAKTPERETKIKVERVKGIEPKPICHVNH
ncbi:hypothetical protein HZF02_07165 [Pseudomonas yamanorum]|nr:hypothetical protein HZF02_07165 [Pseudomonas yamanorum]